jgi:hypothetical protein
LAYESGVGGSKAATISAAYWAPQPTSARPSAEGPHPPAADAAARLFAKGGYERVAVSDVVREAKAPEQTRSIYFQTKEQLITDRDQLVQHELGRLIPAGSELSGPK